MAAIPPCQGDFAGCSFGANKVTPWDIVSSFPSASAISILSVLSDSISLYFFEIPPPPHDKKGLGHFLVHDRRRPTHVRGCAMVMTFIVIGFCGRASFLKMKYFMFFHFFKTKSSFPIHITPS